MFQNFSLRRRFGEGAEERGRPREAEGSACVKADAQALTMRMCRLTPPFIFTHACAWPLHTHTCAWRDSHSHLLTLVRRLSLAPSLSHTLPHALCFLPPGEPLCPRDSGPERRQPQALAGSAVFPPPGPFMSHKPLVCAATSRSWTPSRGVLGSEAEPWEGVGRKRGGF